MIANLLCRIFGHPRGTYNFWCKNVNGREQWHVTIKCPRCGLMADYAVNAEVLP